MAVGQRKNQIGLIYFYIMHTTVYAIGSVKHRNYCPGSSEH